MRTFPYVFLIDLIQNLPILFFYQKSLKNLLQFLFFMLMLNYMTSYFFQENQYAIIIVNIKRFDCSIRMFEHSIIESTRWALITIPKLIWWMSNSSKF